MMDVSVNPTEWTVIGEGVEQTIVLVNGAYKVKRHAKEWTKVSGHLNGGVGSDKRSPRRLVRNFETLEEATKFALDLVRAESAILKAQGELDQVTQTMAIGI